MSAVAVTPMPVSFFFLTKGISESKNRPTKYTIVRGIREKERQEG
jgi:hypothetical protein